MKKKCSRCEALIEEDCFYKNRNTCIYCKRQDGIENKRTPLNRLKSIYRSQVKSSHKRGHSLPEYLMSELIEKFLNTEHYRKLHLEWVESGFERSESPSIHRLNDNIGYSFDNIVLVKWSDNTLQAQQDILEGKLITMHKKVAKLSKKNELIEVYDSLAIASRRNKVDSSAISKVCLGKRKSAGNFKWEFYYGN